MLKPQPALSRCQSEHNTCHSTDTLQHDHCN